MRYEIRASVGTYQHYVVEAESEDKARSQARIDFNRILEHGVEPDVEVTEVPDDTELGDCSG